MRIKDNIVITNECNMELMKRYPDKYFDLAIVDLEYCIGASNPSIKPHVIIQKNGQKSNIKPSNYVNKDWDLKLSSQDYLNELFRVSKNQIIFGGNYYGLSGGYLVWNKLNGESDQFGCEMAWLSFTKRTDIVNFMWCGMFQGVYCGTDIRKALNQQGNKQLNEKRIHPTQKPISLYKWILNRYAKKNDKILDTHLGSMSIAIACADYDFELVGCELDNDYYELGIKRLKNHISQQKISFNE